MCSQGRTRRFTGQRNRDETGYPSELLPGIIHIEQTFNSSDKIYSNEYIISNQNTLSLPNKIEHGKVFHFYMKIIASLRDLIWQ